MKNEYNVKNTLSKFLEKGEGWKILLLGKTEYFTRGEIERFLKRRGLTLVDESGEGIAAVLEGRRMSPADEAVLEALYSAGVPHYRLGEMERTMSESLGERELLMSLKLGYDAERLLRLLENEYLSDELFLKLLMLWRWEGDELMEGESDARILTALLRRFLKAGNYESDIYYSPTSLLRLIRETRWPELLEVLSYLPAFTFRQQRGRSLTLHEALASSESLDATTLRRLQRRREAAVDRALAGNPSISSDTLHTFLEREEPELDRALAVNPSLDEESFGVLLSRGEELRELLLTRQPIDANRWERIRRHIDLRELPPALAANPRIAPEVFETLYEEADGKFGEILAANPALPEGLRRRLLFGVEEGLLTALAANPALSPEELRSLYERSRSLASEASRAIEKALAANPSTPVDLLELFYGSGDEDLLEALAANPSTPMEILHQLKLDFRLFPIVSHNPAFIERANFEMGMR